MIAIIRYLLKTRHWPSRNQRDFLSRDPRRRARVRALADKILAGIREEEEQQ
jgi:hypothetical protein